MRRLNTINLNTPALSERIFRERWRSSPHWIDIPRFELLASKFTGGRYLDLGCFNSPMLYELKQRFPDSDIQGLDHAREVMRVMSLIFPEVRYGFWELPSLPYADGEIDYVVAGEVMEHMEYPYKFVEEIMRVLRVGGTLALSVPKDDYGTMTDEHLWGFDEEDFTELLKKYGTVDVQTFNERNGQTWIVFCTKV